MTKEEAYQMALEMDEDERTAFKAFLSAMLENEGTVLPPASERQECV